MMIRIFTSFSLLFTSIICFGQTSDFVVVSGAQTSNKSTFTVGEIFISGQNSTGFLGAHLTTNSIVSIEDIDSNISLSKMDVYPNPGGDIVKFDVEPELLFNKRLLLYSSNGELVSDQLLSGNTLSLSSLNEGLYSAKIEGYEAVKIVVLR